MYREFWNCEVDEVPSKTGAAPVMDCSDIKDVLSALDITLTDVLDVGCGTGRLRSLCKCFYGVDVSPAMVHYCLREGIAARLINGPDELTGKHEWVTCLSVFTHLPRTERNAYLNAFRSIAPNLLVDILPGKEGGGLAAWHCDPDEFADDLARHDFLVCSTYQRVSLDGAMHLYHLCQLSAR